MAKVTFFSGQQLPLEMHKVRIIQKLNLLPIEERCRAISEAGHNTFLLNNTDVFLDMIAARGRVHDTGVFAPLRELLGRVCAGRARILEVGSGTGAYLQAALGEAPGSVGVAMFSSTLRETSSVSCSCA